MQTQITNKLLITLFTLLLSGCSWSIEDAWNGYDVEHDAIKESLDADKAYDDAHPPEWREAFRKNAAYCWNNLKIYSYWQRCMAAKGTIPYDAYASTKETQKDYLLPHDIDTELKIYHATPQQYKIIYKNLKNSHVL